MSRHVKTIPTCINIDLYWKPSLRKGVVHCLLFVLHPTREAPLRSTTRTCSQGPPGSNLGRHWHFEFLAHLHTSRSSHSSLTRGHWCHWCHPCHFLTSKWIRQRDGHHLVVHMTNCNRLSSPYWESPQNYPVCVGPLHAEAEAKLGRQVSCSNVHIAQLPKRNQKTNYSNWEPKWMLRMPGDGCWLYVALQGFTQHQHDIADSSSCSILRIYMPMVGLRKYISSAAVQTSRKNSEDCFRLLTRCV